MLLFFIFITGASSIITFVYNIVLRGRIFTIRTSMFGKDKW